MTAEAPSVSAADGLLARRRRLLGPAYRLLYQDPVHPVRGEGVWLYDADGNAFLDVYNNVPSVGHCHPRVVAALAEQAARLNTHTRYLHETVLDYAEALLATFPDEIGHVMLTCTGSEANDLAVRAARVFTGGTGFIVTRFAYHGVTVAVAEMSPSLGAGVPLGAHVRTVAAPDTFRRTPAEAAAGFEADVRAALADMQRHGIKPAALLFDTVFASDGVFPATGIVDGAVAAMREAGGLYIADEVQAGLARTGSHMWGFERYGIVPDLVTMGKPMGDGHPIAGMAARPEILAEFGERTRYFNTFGGNPVSAAVGLAVLDVVRDEGLMANAARVGAYLADGLRALQQRHPSLGDIRGAGLYVGMEIVEDDAARSPSPARTTRLVNDLRRRGVLVGISGAHANVVKVRPPLPFSTAHADLFLERLDACLGA
ncbi:aspartate aminotransferase family protein [Labrys monachus]|uniref:4-aminobutyrate aminotransferase-like enzyme n=1 Tax=Labrys monachus TaxID=217067 RepID=A0ABU0FBM0_9HYPH|nr:aspartate aminotransferase family protein [Labrys monachus]MDQ0391488.1 4-aminobutyrate aminotransferase-like enzyme [Labrys monachus]